MSTGIQWTEDTWNPVTGCDRISPGCDNCYALTMAKRLKAMGQEKYQADGDPRTSGPGFGVAVHPDALEAPFHWRKPRRVFVNSMSDLFHARVPRGFIAQVWDVMGRTQEHTYQVLTKRPERMRRWVQQWADQEGDRASDKDSGMPPMPRGPEAVRVTYTSGRARLFADMLDSMGEPPPNAAYPLYDWMEGWRFWPTGLFNVWLGTSIESDEYSRRADELRATPAATRFLSLEPLLGPLPSLDLDRIDWVIIGGESGKNARPLDLRWVRDLMERARDSGTAVFVKQLGACWAQDTHVGGRSVAAHGDSHGSNWDYWPAEFRVREFPGVPAAVTP